MKQDSEKGWERTKPNERLNKNPKKGEEEGRNAWIEDKPKDEKGRKKNKGRWKGRREKSKKGKMDN